MAPPDGPKLPTVYAGEGSSGCRSTPGAGNHAVANRAGVQGDGRLGPRRGGRVVRSYRYSVFTFPHVRAATGVGSCHTLSIEVWLAAEANGVRPRLSQMARRIV